MHQKPYQAVVIKVHRDRFVIKPAEIVEDGLCELQ